MNHSYILLVAGLAIGVLNLNSGRSVPRPDGPAPVTWPIEFEGRPLLPLPLSEMEASFARSFPGAIAHFQCGDDQVILRQVNRATRRLHDSATCLKASGFRIGPRTRETHRGGSWIRYPATRGDRTITVREQISSTQSPGSTWTDVSHWFWHASFHPDQGPWIAVTVLHQESHPRHPNLL